jgi:hypothetical protein
MRQLMNATIYIPTLRRIAYQRTWSSISPRWRERTKLVTVPGETEKLRLRGYPVLERPVQGIANTRQWILDQHEDDGTIVMMDDDLDFYVRLHDDPTKMRGFRPGDFDQMMGELLGLTDVSPLVGIANRSGANRDTRPVRYNTRMHDVLAINPHVVRREGFRFDRVEFMEDFDFILQFLHAGYDTAMLNTYAKGDRGSNQNGGCSVYRTAQSQADAALDLAILWPEVVKMRQVQGSGKSGIWANRTDVTVQWAKAAKTAKEALLLELIGEAA